VRGTCNVNRNLSDDEVRGIAKTGGVIGICYFKGAICSLDPKDVAKAIAHVRDVVGIDYVGLGDVAVYASFRLAAPVSRCCRRKKEA
jgi:microsomal dipeptidase-like Zn-dependent dipeptidase